MVWEANVFVMQGLFFSNDTMVGEAYAAIYQSMVYTNQSQDGVQHDGSFHQHGPELLAGSV